MYRVVIADDDKIILEGLRKEIEWEKLGFEIVNTFNDGETLIEYLKCVRVDVVLTDIKMQYISGIDVARFLHDSDLVCKVVFISGYKEFDLAMQAMKYGVTHYILKPILDGEVEEVMNSIRKELDKMNANIELRQKTELYWAEMRPILSKKLVNSILVSALDDEEEIRQRLLFLYPGMDLMNCPCILVNLEIEQYEKYISVDWKYGIEQLHDAIDNFVGIYEDKAYFHVVNKKNEHFQLFAISKEKEVYCNNLIEDFVGEFCNVFKVEVRINFERVFENISEVVNTQKEIIGINVRCKHIDIEMQERQKELLTNLMEGNISGAKKIMKYSLLYFHGGDIEKCKVFVQEVFVNITNFLGKENRVQNERIEPFLDEKIIYRLQSISEIERYCDQIFDLMKSVEGMQLQFDEKNIIDNIKEYVEQHIFDDICLENVANVVCVSTRHLTRIFKKNTGMTFLQYLTEQKMNKAAELLMQPKSKVFQVGEKLGYRTTSYFVKLFYNYYGCNPSEYKQKIKEKEHGKEK